MAQSDTSGSKLIVGLFGVIGLVIMIGLCSQPNARNSYSSAYSDSTSATASPSHVSVSPEDSVRLRERAREIVRQQRPAGWTETERSRMNFLADTVAFFGDTTDTAVRRWLAAKQQADEARFREQARAAERQADAAKWSYHSESDPMASRPSHTALIQSENAVSFDFPYQGSQYATLILRNHPSYGHDVFLRIERGQILCPSYDDCTVRVRFDDGPAERWTGVGPSDNSTTTVFIRNYSRFLQRMRNAQVVRIQIPVYQEGAPTFEFRVGGFDSARYASGS